jgi:hypothetical protein
MPAHPVRPRPVTAESRRALRQASSAKAGAGAQAVSNGSTASAAAQAFAESAGSGNAQAVAQVRKWSLHRRPCASSAPH